ncbi:DDE-type integrase/transposase/recombinase [Labrys sp. KB_33_2]
MPREDRGIANWGIFKRRIWGVSLRYQHTVEFRLSKHRDLRAAKRFLCRALKRHGRPDRIVIDGSQTNQQAVISCDAENRLRHRSLTFLLTSGESADCRAYDILIGLPEHSPDALLADKGYDADAIRAILPNGRSRLSIPGGSNRRVRIEHDRALYKQRYRIERMLGHLKINRAVATRYDQLANSFLGMVFLATARYWLKFVHIA